MPRPPRIDYPLARHHVMNRGARRAPVFFDDDSCLAFLDLLGDTAARYGLRVHGYALMPNHFHLMVESVHGNLSDALALLCSRYTQEINRRRGWEGPLFRGRFHNRIVVDPSHWRHLLAYLHLNPVRARLVAKPEQWDWSSHDAYSGATRPPDWLVVDDLTREFAATGGYRGYLREVKQGRREKPDRFEDALFGRGRSSSLMVVKQEPTQPMTADAALAQVLKVTGARRGGLRESRPGRGGNEARVVAAYWLVHGAKLTNVAAGKLLAMSPIAVSKAHARVRRELLRNPQGSIYSAVVALEELIGK